MALSLGDPQGRGPSWRTPAEATLPEERLRAQGPGSVCPLTIGGLCPRSIRVCTYEEVWWAGSGVLQVEAASYCRVSLPPSAWCGQGRWEPGSRGRWVPLHRGGADGRPAGGGDRAPLQIRH